MMGDSLRIVSANVRGIRQTLKRIDIWNKLKELNANIVLLQETHLMKKDLNDVRKEWNIEFILSDYNTNSRGVAILIQPNFEYKLTHIYSDKTGRYQIITMDIANKFSITLTNIYGPNQDDPELLKEIFHKSNELQSDFVIYAGDWNVALDDIDRYNYKSERNSKNIAQIKEQMRTNNLIDIWRLQNPDGKRFTWGTKKPYKRARLDFFLLSGETLSIVPEAKIHANYKSDHNMISLDLKLNDNRKGKGSWKFNNNLLKNKDFVKIIKEEIRLTKHIYALPIYSHETVDTLNELQLELMISDSLFLDTLLCQLRGTIISFSKKISRERRINEKALETEIQETILEIEASDHLPLINELNNKLSNLQEQYEEIRENRMRGHLIRSRSEIMADWEKPSKYFLNLEKRNYVNKTILELKTENGNKINDPTEILKLQKEFYQDLFSTKKTINIENSYFDPYLINLPTLSEEMKNKLDEPFTIEELDESIKKSKLNKAPGPDGYTNEFFKFFKDELIVWLYRVYLESFQYGELSPNIINGTITCIPKGGKLRTSLKNWRPLTLLNGTYKFLSAMISERVKTVLQTLINNDQTGFITNRFIGENTRLLFDIINYAEIEQIPGLLIIVDYAKAFDTIEWNFINKSLKLFNFGTELIKWIALLRENSFSRVEQNGNFSENIVLSRGCRQGDPISPYLFVLCAEILSHVIREYPDIKGIETYGVENKLSQYADDTTLFIKADLESLTGVIRVLDWFKKISGLEVNKDKTKVIKIGAIRDRSISLEGKFGLDWTTEFEVLGIKYRIKHMTTITDDNISSKIVEMKKLIAVWNTRNLTPYGKVTILKSLIYSKITHILLSLPNPSDQMFKELQSMVDSFLWNKKPPKFRKEILEADTLDGGLKLHNLKTFCMALKLGWIKRYLSSKANWTNFPDYFEFREICSYGKNYIDRIYDITDNPFWKNVLDAIIYLWDTNRMITPENTLLSPLWLNHILQIPIKRSWKERGINIVNDVLDNNRQNMSLEDFQTTYNIQTNFLEYGAFCWKICNYMRRSVFIDGTTVYPCNSYLNVILSKDKKGVSNIYKQLLGKNDNIITNACTKWSDKISSRIDFFSMRKSFNKIQMVDDVYLRYIQFRTLHRRFYTNDKLFKMKIKESSLCDMCKIDEDSVEHMLIKCSKSRILWRDVEIWLSEVGLADYIIDEQTIILGENKKSFWINAIILITKKVIFNAKLNCKTPSIFSVKFQTRALFNHEELKYNILQRNENFVKRWGLLIDYFEETEL